MSTLKFVPRGQTIKVPVGCQKVSFDKKIEEHKYYSQSTGMWFIVRPGFNRNNIPGWIVEEYHNSELGCCKD